MLPLLGLAASAGPGVNGTRTDDVGVPRLTVQVGEDYAVTGTQTLGGRGQHGGPGDDAGN